MAEWIHDVTIQPDTMNGERGWWSASVSGGDYDGAGRSIEEALLDLIDNLLEALAEAESKLGS